jgi:formate dehydrogenase subunit delta
MNIERMVEMANDIANFFVSEPDHAAAVAGVAGHIRRYWEPRMRKQMLAHLDAGGHGLSDLAREAVQELARMQKAA